IQKRNEEIAAETRLLPYAERERASVSHQVSGAVYQVHVDSTHPLGYGLNGTYHTLRNHTNRFVYLKNGVNVGTIRNARDHRSGFVGYAVRDRVEATLVFGEQRLGKGYVVYFVDDPIFRGFWEPGKLLLSNAL